MIYFFMIYDFFIIYFQMLEIASNLFAEHFLFHLKMRV